MLEKLNIHSIAFKFIWVLMIGLLVPMTAGIIITMRQEKVRLQKELDDFHRDSLTTLAHNIEDALVSFSPEGVTHTANILLRDNRIISVEVFSNVFDLHLLRVSKQTSGTHFNTISLSQTISRGNDTLGHVRIEVDKDWIQTRIRTEQRHTIILFSTMFAGGLLLIFPAIYYKILKPLSLLTRQTKTFSKSPLEAVCHWEGKDEISLLGRRLDHMRRQLSQNFKLMEKLAVTDELTGLPNRRGFSMEIEKLLHLSTRYGDNLSLAILDLDYFKAITDTHGHGIGDEVLNNLCQSIGDRVRKSDLFARIGGEAFVLVMPKTDLPAAVGVLNTIREQVHCRDYPHGDSLTVSIGVTAGNGGCTLDQLMDRADKALHLAKAQGRNRVVALSPS